MFRKSISVVILIFIVVSIIISLPDNRDVEKLVRSSSLSEVIVDEGDRQRIEYYDKNGQIAFAADKHYATQTRLHKVAQKLLEIVNENDTDLLFGNMMFSDGMICRIIKERVNIPYVIAVQDTDINLWFLWKLKWLREEGYNNLKKADAIIFLSEAYRNKLIDKILRELKKIL